MKGPVRIGELAATNPSLRDLFEQTQTLKALEQRIGERLGENFAANFSAARLREDGTLVLTAISPTWATRLRYIAPELLQWARSTPDLKHIQAIDILIQRIRLT